MPWVALIAAGVAAVGNIIANSTAADRAKMTLDQNFRDWMSVNIPDPDQQRVVLDRFVQQGQLDPVLQKAIAQEPTEFKNIVTDAKQKAAQTKALSQLEEIGEEGGLRLQDKAALQDAQMDAQVAERSNREGIAADMARRGLGGSGFEVAAKLAGQQGGADRAANSSLKVAAMAQQRALDAIQGAGDLATKYRTQDFGEQGEKATAADRINAFNTANLRDVNAANTGLANRAQEMNLASKQDIANRNVETQNKQQMYNSGLAQQQFENQLKRTAGATGQYGNVAQAQMQQGQAQGNAFTNVGTGVSQAATAQQNQEFWDKYFASQKGK